MAKKKKAKPDTDPNPKTILVVVQEGGTTTELYASSYDKEKHAVDAIRGHNKATYNAYGPYLVPEKLTKALMKVEGAEGEFLELIETIAADAAIHKFAEVEADEDDGDDEEEDDEDDE